VVSVVETWRNTRADYTIASRHRATPRRWQFVAPYSGCAMGEYFRDWVGTPSSLRRLPSTPSLTPVPCATPPSGREASRATSSTAQPVVGTRRELNYRRAKFNPVYPKGGAPLRAPIIRDAGSDYSAYIPTNVISITDGQIYSRSDCFYAGIRPPCPSVFRQPAVPARNQGDEEDRGTCA